VDGEWTRLRSLPTGTQGEPVPIDIDIDSLITTSDHIGGHRIASEFYSLLHRTKLDAY